MMHCRQKRESRKQLQKRAKNERCDIMYSMNDPATHCILTFECLQRIFCLVINVRNI